MKKKVLSLAASLLTLSALTSTVLANDPVWDGNTVILGSERLAEGVYAYYPNNAKEFEQKGLPVATSGGFIVGDKGVLVIDTMLNQRLNTQMQKLVSNATETIRGSTQRATKTSAPILYAVNTSFHGDHSYGNMYLPKETMIIQHVNAKKYIDEHFVKDTEFMIQNFGTGRGIEEIEPVTGDILIGEKGKVTIDLGGKYVEIIDFGFAQTGGDLFVWEPQSKVLWTGNPIITVKPSLPWLLDGHLVETLETLQAVYDFLPMDARIIPGHGTVMGKEDLIWHIDYLKAVKSQVQEAINEGLTLEQTVEKVLLPEFQGYALYPWVHPQLNVPAAYKDLKK